MCGLGLGKEAWEPFACRVVPEEIAVCVANKALDSQCTSGTVLPVCYAQSEEKGLPYVGCKSWCLRPSGDDKTHLQETRKSSALLPPSAASLFQAWSAAGSLQARGAATGPEHRIVGVADERPLNHGTQAQL